MPTKNYNVRRSGLDRRSGKDRRKVTLLVQTERRVGERRVLLRRMTDILRDL